MRLPWRFFVLLLAVSAMGRGEHLAAQNSPPPAAQLAAKIQAHYDTVRDFTADWTLTQTSPLRPQPKTERGEVKVKKPLKMRWTYTTSDKQQFVSDGVRIYSTFPQDRYVEVSPLPAENETSAWLLFLAGRGNLTRDYTSKLAAEQQPGEWRVVLEPAGKRQADFKTLTLEVDRTTFQIRGLVVTDEQGATSVYRFANIRENRGLSDREFVFTFPKGYEQRSSR
jgi:outer membrane lipoprotein carrier protein